MRYSCIKGVETEDKSHIFVLCFQWLLYKFIGYLLTEIEKNGTFQKVFNAENQRPFKV